MAQLFIHESPLSEEEIHLLRVKRFLALSPEIRVKQGLALISLTAKIRMAGKKFQMTEPRIRIKAFE